MSLAYVNVISQPQLHRDVGGRLYAPARSIIPALLRYEAVALRALLYGITSPGSPVRRQATLSTEYDDREPAQYSQTKWLGCRPSRPAPPLPRVHRRAALRPIRRESWRRVPHSYLAHPQRTRSTPAAPGVSASRRIP